MPLLRITSPHAHGPLSTSRVMQNVLLATIPGIIVLTHFFGFGTLVNIVWGSAVALACEALALKLRRRPLGFYLKDYSALVTAFLLCIALPPYSPWWVIAVGIASAILLAKHLYGGLGYNPFNPAMAGYVIVLISYTGRTRETVEIAQHARTNGATVIGITMPGSPLAEVCTVVIEVTAPEDTEVYMPMSSRIIHLTVIDILATGVTLKRGADFLGHLKKIKESLKPTRFPTT